MQRKHLAATVAAGPLMALAFAGAPLNVRAEVQITTATTAPVATATATAGGPDNITVTPAGSITPTTSGPIITLNSNNTVTVSGALSTNNVSNSTGVLVMGGNTGAVTINSGLNLVSSLTPPDNDGDGDADGPLADGSNRYGLRVIGPGAFTGNLTLNAGGALLISGADSAGISIETAVAGNLTQSGSINATGDRAYGLRLTGPLTGSARLNGATSAFGVNAVGVAIDADVSGAVLLQGAVTSSGYRYTNRPQLSTDRARLDADDLLQGGPAVRISGNVGGGVLFDAPPTLAANDDGTFDTDGDGTADSLEGSSSVITYGSAPAVLIGSATSATTLGVAGTGSNAFGLINRGTITADGLFDGASATGIQIGGGAGFGVGIANGFSNSGAINANAYEAKATALNILGGVSAPSIVNSGVITGASTSSVASSANGLVINPGATVTSINNSGTISAEATGPKIDVTAIADLAGGVTRIDNSGLITAAIVNNSTTPTTGRGIAIDARANTAGLAIVQTGVLSTAVSIDTDGDGINDNAEPNIYGDVLFGSGADRLDLSNGSLAGAMAFGAGADVLTVSGGAKAIGALTDTDGKLAISLAKGTLAIQNAATINATSLNVSSADSQLLFAADPANGAATKLVVGSATIANNAQIGITLASVLDASTRYTVVQAGSLNVGAVRASLTGSPYLYVTSASSNAALGQVYVDVRPRSATEMGFNATQAGAFGAIMQALKTDSALAAPLLSQTGRDGLVHLYDQLLPDLGGGTFDALAYSAEQIAQGLSQRPDPYDRYGPDSLWAQEVNTLVRTETTDTMGSDTQVFGFAGGYEAMGEFGGALGVAVAYLNTQERDNAAQVGERTTSSVLQGDLYWRRSVGGLRLTVGGGGGYGWMNGQRRFFSGDMNSDGVNDLERANSAKWNGLLGHAFTSVAYEQGFGRFYARPEGRLDYLYLREGRRRETGGGSGFDLTTEERTSSALNALAALTFGASFGRELWWRPEVRVGYRKQIAGSMGDTVAQFTGGSAFTLPGAENKDGAVTLDVALRAGTPMSYVAVEGGVAAAKKQKRYNLRLAGRMMF